MIWQDFVIMVGGFAFILALLPAIRSKQKPPRATCLATGSILAVFCIAYATLGLWLAFAGTSVVSALWFILFFQRRK